MYCYHLDGAPAASLSPNLPLPAAESGIPARFLVHADPALCPAVWRVTDPRQLTADRADVTWLDPGGWETLRSCRRRSGPLWPRDSSPA